MRLITIREELEVIQLTITCEHQDANGDPLGRSSHRFDQEHAGRLRRHRFPIQRQLDGRATTPATAYGGEPGELRQIPSRFRLAMLKHPLEQVLLLGSERSRKRS